MTEIEWLKGDDPAAMLAWWTGQSGDQTVPDWGRKASDRKLRLFVCACCRIVWHRLTDPRSRRAVEVAERFADGEATEEELEAAYLSTEQVEGANWGTEWCPAVNPDRWASWAAVAPVPHGPRESAHIVIEHSHPDLQAATQAAILRDIVGNPFQRPAIDQSWLTSDVRAIAEHAYAERDFDALPIAADALEEAGCTNEEMLGHLRGLEPVKTPQGGRYWRSLRSTHARGCFVLDLLLGKE